ncbi:MAG TPA: YdeI/OmpD-associated family protein [Candidatus Saccharimonadales bacterium]|nr:YdeI/OmpD-associated family protein [Candidatus Saccharimonadales bacterium]
MTTKVSEGTVHRMPADLRKALVADAKVLALWEDITPLARNEFICWVENAKMIDTRARRITRTCEELLEGKRRPCCWVGCIHRPDKAMSPSVQWALSKQAKKS